MLRKLMRRTYWAAQNGIRQVVGSALEERRWRNRADLDTKNVDAPHRPWLAAEIARLKPESVLEVGCGWGPNLVQLSRLTDARLFGAEINPHALDAARTELASHGCEASIVQTTADDLSAFESESMDVVFSDAVLIYVGPDKIATAITEMQRVARKAVMLLELHEDAASDNWRGYWVRDYYQFADASITKLPSSVWPGEPWGSLGHLIVIVK